MERGGDATCGLATGTRTGVVLVLRRKFGSSFLGSGLGGGCFRGCGSFPPSCIGTTAVRLRALLVRRWYVTADRTDGTTGGTGGTPVGTGEEWSTLGSGWSGGKDNGQLLGCSNLALAHWRERRRMLESCGEVSSSGDYKFDGGRGGYGDLSWEPHECISDSFS